MAQVYDPEALPELSDRYLSTEEAKRKLRSFLIELKASHELTITEELALLNEMQGELLSSCLRFERKDKGTASS